MDSRKLENKHGNWKFANKSWIIPEKGGRGYIEESDTNLVLTLSEYNSRSEIFLTVKMIIWLSFSQFMIIKYLVCKSDDLLRQIFSGWWHQFGCGSICRLRRGIFVFCLLLFWGNKRRQKPNIPHLKGDAMNLRLG